MRWATLTILAALAAVPAVADERPPNVVKSTIDDWKSETGMTRFVTIRRPLKPRSCRPQRPPIAEIVGSPKSGIANVPTVEELERICPDPWTNPPAECADALDRRYMLEGVRVARLHYGGFNWAPRPQPLAHEIPWREAFADPVRTRLAVEEALANPDCLDPPAGSAALRETCAADEMAKLAMITEGCVMPLIMAGLLDSSSPADQEPIDTHFRSRRQLDTPTIRDEMWFWHIEMLDDDTSLTQEQY